MSKKFTPQQNCLLNRHYGCPMLLYCRAADHIVLCPRLEPHPFVTSTIQLCVSMCVACMPTTLAIHLSASLSPIIPVLLRHLVAFFLPLPACSALFFLPLMPPYVTPSLPTYATHSTLIWACAWIGIGCNCAGFGAMQRMGPHRDYGYDKCKAGPCTHCYLGGASLGAVSCLFFQTLPPLFPCQDWTIPWLTHHLGASLPCTYSRSNCPGKDTLNIC